MKVTDKITITNECNMELMKRYPDNYFDLAIVDPPYFKGPNKSGYYGKGYSNLGVKRSKYYDEIEDDCWQLPEKKYFDELIRVSKNQIIWGANHFSNVFDSNSSCWIVWDKDNGNSSFADAEIAYTSFSTAVRIFKYMWNGMHQGSKGGNTKLNEKRIHPTQKPVCLYEWTLDNYAEEGFKILDTHLGSGSTAIACHNRCFELVACDKSKTHFDSAIKRINNHTKQLTMF